MEDLKKNHRSQVMKLLSNLGMDDIKPGQSKDVLTERLLSNSAYFSEHEIPGILNFTLNIDGIKTALEKTVTRDEQGMNDINGEGCPR